MTKTKIPDDAYNNEFVFNGSSYDPVEFLKHLDSCMYIHHMNPGKGRSPFHEYPPVHREQTFEFDGHTYTHVAEHSGRDTTDYLMRDGVPDGRAWQRVIDQITKAHPALFPDQFRPLPGLDYAENDGGMGPISTVEQNFDEFSDALLQFAALREYPGDTTADDPLLIHQFANAAIPAMTANACAHINEKFPGGAVVNSRGDLCFSPAIIYGSHAASEAIDTFFSSALDGMEKFADQVNAEYERAVENGDIVPDNNPER